MEWTPTLPAYYTASFAAVLVYEWVLTVEIMLTTPREGLRDAGRQRRERNADAGGRRSTPRR